MAPPGKLLETRLLELSKSVPQLRRFLEEQPGVGVVCAGFRNDYKEESRSLEKAWNALAAIIDGFAFINEGPLPEICPVIQVREGNEAETQIKIYGGSGRLGPFSFRHPGFGNKMAGAGIQFVQPIVDLFLHHRRGKSEI